MKVKKGDKIKVHYKGTLDDGNEFDSSEGREPLEFIAGAGQVIPGFENAVIGMEVGEEKEVKIPSDEAYGPHREELVREFDKTMLPDESGKVGTVISVEFDNGQSCPGMIVEITDDKFKVDINHPLSGHNLNFKIKVEEIMEENCDVENCGCGCSGCGDDKD